MENKQEQARIRHQNRVRRIRRIKNHLEEDGRFKWLKDYNHHGTTSVHTHVLHVAWWANRIAESLPVEVDMESLTRGALLHDYFLYDWHDDHGHSPHGFTHPFTALKNARDDFDLTEREVDIIKTHMWPLTVVPPKHREGWIVTMADKIATWEETLGKRKPPKRLKKKSSSRHLQKHHGKNMKTESGNKGNFPSEI